MEALDIALSLSSDISEEEGNRLAIEIIRAEGERRESVVPDVAVALLNLSQYRCSGCGFSREASDAIAIWILEHFDESRDYTDKLIDLIHELTSEKSDDLVRELCRTVESENLKDCLLEAFSYKGT